MKYLAAIMVIMLPVCLFAQRKEKSNSQRPYGNYSINNTHHGLYFSIGAGVVFNEVHYTVTDGQKPGDLILMGNGVGFDLKAGAAITPNIILHATLLQSILKAEPKSGSLTVPSTSELSIGESTIGAGATYYFMPVNVFTSASAGLGKFNARGITTHHINTRRGFSLQVKVGKEWWVSKTCGVGIGIIYSKTMLTNKDDGITQKFNGDCVGFLFSATFN